MPAKKVFAGKYSGGNNVPPRKCQSYVFTSFNVEKPVFTDQMKYMLYAPEVCPETGRDHWQGYIVFKNQRTITAIQKKTTPKFSFLKKAEGGIAHQLSYIRGPYNSGEKNKPFNPAWEEFGTRPKGQGHRSDLDELAQKLKDGETTVDKIVMDDPIMYHKYGRTLSKIEDVVLRSKYRTEMTTGLWIYGPTGTGKSHKAFKGYNPSTHYVWKDDKGWQDGYTGQETVIINDFRGSIPYNELLQMIDKWPHFVRRRGREPAPFIAKNVIITSSLSPADVYNRRNDRDEIAQLLRRIVVEEMI